MKSVVPRIVHKIFLRYIKLSISLSSNFTQTNGNNNG